MNRPILRAMVAAALLALGTLATTGAAQQGVRRYQCAGTISGVATQAWLEITPGGMYTEGPGVAGRIRNPFADYLFSGTLFGLTEGFVSLVETRTGARMDRVWIGVGPLGFALRTEDGVVYPFRCRS